MTIENKYATSIFNVTYKLEKCYLSTMKSLPFGVRCLLNSHTYLNKSVVFSCMFV